MIKYIQLLSRMCCKDFRFLVTLNDIDQQEIHNRTVVHLCLSIFSFIGSGSIVLTILLKKRACSPAVLPVLHLCLSDLGGSTLSLVSDIFYFKKKHLIYPLTPIIINCLFMVSFLLVSNYVFKVWREVYKKSSFLTLDSTYKDTKMSDRVIEKFCNRFPYSLDSLILCFCWVLPFLMTLVPFCFLRDPEKKCLFQALPNMIYMNDVCSITPVVNLMFITTLGISFVFILVTYTVTYFKYRKLLKSQDLAPDSQYILCGKFIRQAAHSVVSFIICWILTVAVYIITTQHNFDNVPHLIIYFQVATSSLQGLFNAYVYGWHRAQFRQVISETIPLIDINSRVTFQKPNKTLIKL